MNSNIYGIAAAIFSILLCCDAGYYLPGVSPKSFEIAEGVSRIKIIILLE